MTNLSSLAQQLREEFAKSIVQLSEQHAELTMIIARDSLQQLSLALRDKPAYAFKQLIDVCGVDYLEYGVAEWETENATSNGFDRGVNRIEKQRVIEWQNPRFAVVYHLLSHTHNQRLRIKVFLSEEDLQLPSVIDIWPAANWFEREVFDMFGIVFNGHPDLRRILTDYGFIGHPFRKDFPLSGHVEPRYDAHQARVVYEPVDIQPRVLVPKVIREDSRYKESEVDA
jgi:NADH-quinone oxidoreductase subunit C